MSLAAGFRSGRYVAYSALVLALIGLPLIGMSEGVCRFAGRPDQDYTSDLTEPGKTGGIVSFALAPLIAITALALLVRARRTGLRTSRLAFAAAIAAFPVAVVDFLLWVLTAAFSCGLGLS